MAVPAVTQVFIPSDISAWLACRFGFMAYNSDFRQFRFPTLPPTSWFSGKMWKTSVAYFDIFCGNNPLVGTRFPLDHVFGGRSDRISLLYNSIASTQCQYTCNMLQTIYNIFRDSARWVKGLNMFKTVNSEMHYSGSSHRLMAVTDT